MYDDIAQSEENPRPGVIINNPHGEDVYKGVPKVCVILESFGHILLVETVFLFHMWRIFVNQDYVDNFFAVILGNRIALTGGSRKVVDSGPNDHIFIYYGDLGGPGVLG